MRRGPFASLILLSCLATVPAGEALMGSHAFRATPDSPVGYRGDGTGWWPGTTPVTEFYEYAPEQGEVDLFDKWKGVQKKNGYTLAKKTSKNIVWKTPMPSWTNGEPMVVGDKVFTLGEPDLLICVDGNSGKILWQERINAWAVAGLPQQKAELCREMYTHYLAALSFARWRAMTSSHGRYVDAESTKRLLGIYFEKDLPTILAGLKKLDPATDYAAAAKASRAGWDAFLASPEINEARKDKMPKDKNVRQQIFGLHTLIGERIVALGGQSTKELPLEMPWNSMCGFAPSVPLSDGEHVYVHLGQGQVACYTLDGKQVWTAKLPKPTVPGGNNGSVHQYGALHLADGVLVSGMAQCGHALTGFDAGTGKKLWEAGIGTDDKVNPVMGGHRLVDLDGLKVIAASAGAIVRVKDGKRVGEFPRPGGGSVMPVTGYGNIVVVNTGNWNGTKSYLAYRLEKKSDDAVAATQLWTTGTGAGAWKSCRKVAATDRILVGMEKRLLDLQSGKVLADSKGILQERCFVTGPKAEVVIQMKEPGGDATWSRRRPDGKAVMTFPVWDLSDPAKPQRLREHNILVTDTDPLFAGVEKLLANCWADEEFFNVSGGKPAAFTKNDGGIFPNGNRLFIRSVTDLYCIGDPKQAWK